MICSRCGFTNDGFLPGITCPSCGCVYSSEPEKKVIYPQLTVPLWESPYSKEFPLSSFFRTSKEIFVNPDLFFGKLQSKSDLLSAWLYALIGGSLGYVIMYLWTQIFPPMDLSMFSDKTETLFATEESSSSTTLLYTPILITLEILFLTLYAHLMLIITRKRKKSLYFTFKIVSYSQCALLLNFIPVAGSFLSTVFMIFQIITGISHVHETSKFKAFISLFIPLIALLLLLVVFLFAAMIFGVAATGFLESLTPFLNN